MNYKRTKNVLNGTKKVKNRKIKKQTVMGEIRDLRQKKNKTEGKTITEN